LQSVALLTNNPDKVKQLESHGINVARKVPLIAGISDENVGYLQTKIRRMGHMIDSSELE
jgi:3,4-dihydroxy 2-butanone 4-phosphate synthase/GTP cyclohydrolase II